MTSQPPTRQWLFMSDVDDTLLGDDDALKGLATEIEVKRETIILAFNSSRPCTSVRRSIKVQPLLPEPDYLIGALGTEIEEGDSRRLLKEYSDSILNGWEREKVTALMSSLGLEAHPEEFQTRLKASYYVEGKEQYLWAVEELASLEFEVKIIYSGQTNLDVIPKRAGKGAAIDYLRRKLEVDENHVVAAGDSTNDLDMFVPPNKGILVANADPAMKELSGEHIYHAKSGYAAGVLEGLRFWGVL